MKRLLALAGSIAAGMAGALVLASPAQAHHPEVKGEFVCQVDGTYKITWTVKNGDFDSPLMKIKTVDPTPDGDITEIKEGVWLEKNASLKGVQIVPGTTTEAKLYINATWHKTKEGEAKVEEDADGKVKPVGTCVPAKAAVGQGDCTNFSVTVTTSAEHKATTATVKYGTQTKPVTLKDGGDSQKVDLSPSSETEATVTFADSTFTATVAYNKPANCGGLPQTGSSTTTMIAGGTGAAALGAFIFFMARRRMVKLRQLADS
ncbi:MAG TPA: LPXTG cell wall anchor domain-containing protein [Candidatus Limnocylindrales bacterium]